MFYLVSYDITVDRTRTKAMKYLKDLGYHLQKSVFVVDCDTKARATAIYNAVLQMIDPKTDRLLMTPVCSACWDKVMIRGQSLAVDDDIWIA